MADIHPNNKCEHGVYWPPGHKIAFYCQFCNPNENPDRKAKPFFSKRYALSQPEMQANLHNPGTSRCPRSECRSGVHYESEENKRIWVCADCGHTYRRPNANG